MLMGFFAFAQMDALRSNLRVGGTYQDPVPDKFHTPIIWYALENAQNEDYWKDVDISKVVMILRSGKDERSAGISSLLRKWNINRVVGRSIQPEAINFITVEFPNPTRERVLNFLREAKENPDVIVAEPEVIHRKMACPPNDTYWNYQWGPYVIWADSAWCYTRGDTMVMVAVLDQGVDYTHPDLGNVRYGYDFVDNDSDPRPDNPYTEEHGTHVAGIVAATLNNSLGIAGMANVRIFAGRVLDETGGGTSTWVANGILGASSISRVRVINMSLGSSTPSSLIQMACDTAWNRGKLLIAASGNDGSYGISYPAAFPSVIAVGAIGTDGYYLYLAPYSNYGPQQEITAPGGDNNTGYCILSTLPLNSYGDVGWGCSWVGTSMATPHVSGVAALVFSVRPSLTNSMVRTILRNSTFDLGSPGWDMYYGYGMICAHCAVLNAITGIEEGAKNETKKPFELNGNILKVYEEASLFYPNGAKAQDIKGETSIALKKGVYFLKVKGRTYKILVL
ncbi:MAG: S8 family peptidase [Candidatus Caldipriscus sp.]